MVSTTSNQTKSSSSSSSSSTWFSLKGGGAGSTNANAGGGGGGISGNGAAAATSATTTTTTTTGASSTTTTIVTAGSSSGPSSLSKNTTTTAGSINSNNNPQLQQQQQQSVLDVIPCLYPQGAATSSISFDDGGGSGSSTSSSAGGARARASGGGGGISRGIIGRSLSSGGAAGISRSRSFNAASSRRRFSPLLLEHGEKHLQDWAVMGYSSIVEGGGGDNDHHDDDVHDGGGGGGGGGLLSSAGNNTMGTTTTPPKNKKNYHHSSSSSSSHKHHHNAVVASGGVGGGQGQGIQWSSSPMRTTSSGTSHHNHNKHHKHHHHHHNKPSTNTTARHKATTVILDREALPSSVTMNRIEGRLHLCSRSLVFEPNDSRRGIVRCPLKDLLGAPKEYPNNNEPDDDDGGFETIAPSIRYTSRRHFLVKENNVIGPYLTVNEHQTRFSFCFLHSSPSILIQICDKLFDLMTGKNDGSGGGGGGCSNRRLSQIQPLIDDMIKPMLDRPFSPENLVTIREQREYQEQQLQQCQQQQQQQQQGGGGGNSTSTSGTVNSRRCYMVSPLLEQPGVVCVTSERIYFQPAIGLNQSKATSSAPPPAQNWLLTAIQATARRYHGLRDSSLELYFHTSGGGGGGGAAQSILLAFERRHDRETVLRCIQQQQQQQYPPPTSRSFVANTSPLVAAAVCFTDRDFVVRAYKAWTCNQISNFEYLLALNCAAGRNFHDLSRYPVFPWILSDYGGGGSSSGGSSSSKLDLTDPKTFRDLSKPIGALNPDRLEYFKARMEGMQEAHQQLQGMDGEFLNSNGNDDDDQPPQLHQQAFLFGTHYSAPGYILYFLVRSMPEHMLCLQNGKFDAPDRMFHSLNSCYQCALTNHADVKELIAEFYYPQSFDFLINAKGLPLGATQQGDRVDDVQLPSWAKSPRDFVKKHRLALESDYVSENLHEWIDLIFGYKSRGSMALESNNLFHPCAYLGPTDLAALKTEQERYQAELQATEFGTVPDQLFVGPHPPKKCRNNKDHNEHDFDVDEDETAFISQDVGRASSSKEEDNNREAWELISTSTTTNTANDSGGTQQQQSVADNNNLASLSLDNTDDNRGVVNLGGEGGAATAANSNSNSPWRAGLSAGTALSEAIEKDIAAEATAPPNNLPLRGTGESISSTTFSTPGRNNDEIRCSSFSEQDAARTPPTSMNPSSNSNDSATSGVSKTPPPSLKLQSFSDSPDKQLSECWDMKFLDRAHVHSDSVSGCVLLLNDDTPDNAPNKPSLLATTSLDGGLKVHKVSLRGSRASASPDHNPERKGFPSTLSRFSYSTIMSRGQIGISPTNTAAAMPSKLTEYRSHSSRDPLASLVLANDGNEGYVAFAGGHDDVVLAYGISSACAVASLYSHRDAVTGLDLIPRTPFDAESALWLENSTHIMVSGSWDATVKVWSASVSGGEAVAIHRDPLAELFDADSSIVCVTAKAVPSMGGIVIGVGCADGSFCVWNVHNDGVQVVIHKEPARRGSGPCSVVKWVSTPGGGLYLFAAFSTGMVASYSLIGGGSALQRVSAVSVGVAVLSLVFAVDGGFLLVGTADGALRLIPITDGASFEKPTLWSAVNNKSSPGISSISVTLLASSQQDSRESAPTRFVCCTGGEDGSLALFELQKIANQS